MKKTTMVILGIILIAFVFLVFHFKSTKHPLKVTDESMGDKSRVRKKVYDFDTQKCPGESILVKSDDVYMRGLIEQGQEVSVQMNYFKCQSPEQGNLILYRYSEFDNPVIKRIVATPGDKFEVFETKQGWILKVNGKFVTGIKGENYLFGGNLPPPLALAAKAKKGILGKNEVIILSSFPPGDKDSGVFGVISLNDIVGKIENHEKNKQ